jgi:II/X family phage/plasmid replication protein
MQAMERLCEVLPLSPTRADRDAWLHGDVKLTRIDITRSYSLSNRRTVLEWLHHAQIHATMAYRGKGEFTGDTLYFGKRSKYSTLKAYSKGQEIEVHKVGADVLTDSLREWAEDKLRIELTLRGRELRRIGKSKILDWAENDTNDIFNEYMDRLEIASRINMTHEELETLPPRLRLAYQSWKDGNDLKKTVSRATYYRYKKELSTYGVDITVPQTKKTPENVIPFVRVLEAQPCEQIPDWAYGTKLLISR